MVWDWASAEGTGDLESVGIGRMVVEIAELSERTQIAPNAASLEDVVTIYLAKIGSRFDRLTNVARNAKVGQVASAGGGWRERFDQAVSASPRVSQTAFRRGPSEREKTKPSEPNVEGDETGLGRWQDGGLHPPYEGACHHSFVADPSRRVRRTCGLCARERASGTNAEMSCKRQATLADELFGS